MADFLLNFTDKIDKSIRNNFKKLGGGTSEDTQSISFMESIKSLFSNPKIKYYLILLTILVISFIIYIYVGFNRINRCLNVPRNIYISYLSELENLSDNKKYMSEDYKVKDFYVASSYKSYLPYGNYFDLASIDALKFNLYHGARLIDLDIMNKTFTSCTEPVVCNGIEIGNYQLTTTISFDKVMDTLSTYSFNKYLRNNKDPLFINLNFKTWYNKDTINKCAKIIKKHFQNKLLDNNYAFQGKYSGYKLLNSSIKTIIDKVIFMSNNDLSNTDMDEIINLGTKGACSVKYMNFDEIKNTYDENEIKNFNKSNSTLVYPNTLTRVTENVNYLIPKYMGCQFILMNYSKPDDWMIEYIKDFKFCSFILKPFKLRNI